jgi:hypothetical protein
MGRKSRKVVKQLDRLKRMQTKKWVLYFFVCFLARYTEPDTVNPYAELLKTWEEVVGFIASHGRHGWTAQAVYTLMRSYIYLNRIDDATASMEFFCPPSFGK